MIDSHCHLLDARYTEQQPPLTPEEIIADARCASVTHLIGIACRRDEWEPYLAVAATTPDVSLALGIHPLNVDEGPQFTGAELLDLAANPKVVALGETGLDYSPDNPASRPAQRMGFHTHLEAAQKVGLPVVVHTYQAEGHAFYSE